MDISAFIAFRDFMAAIWRLFTGWHLPFSQVTPAMLLFFGLSVKLIIKFLIAILHVGPAGIGYTASDQLRRAYLNRYYD